MSYSLQDALSSLQDADADVADSDDNMNMDMDMDNMPPPSPPPRLETQRGDSMHPPPAAASAATATAVAEDGEEFPSSPVHSSSSSNTNTNANTNTNTNKQKQQKQVVRVPILRGTLFETTIWNDQNLEETPKRQHILKGTWRYNDTDTTTNITEAADQPFELIRNLTKEDYDNTPPSPAAVNSSSSSSVSSVSSSSLFFIPSNGLYNGTFRLSYEHTTPKGKQTIKTTSMEENNVKLEFRKLSTTATPSSSSSSSSNSYNFYYRIHGSGSNNIGTFSLSGTAKPTAMNISNSNNKFIIELRKTYFGMGTANTTNTTNANANANANAKESSSTLSSSSSSSSSLLLQSQKQSLLKNTTTTTSTNTHQHQQRASIVPSISMTTTPGKSSSSSSSTSSSRKPKPPPPPPPPPSSQKQQQQQQQRQRQQQQQQQRRDKEPNTTTTAASTPNDHHQEKQTAAAVATVTETAAVGGGTVDRVNGKGMWHAWTRSFDTPLLALLDLFDNAVDASWTLLPPKLEPEQSESELEQLTFMKPKIRVDIDKIGRNGVVMRNGSKFIPSLKQVLQVYKSNKTSFEDNSIGENGIGVKHACASLSTLSLVFTKSKRKDNNTYLSMGLLMQDLQRDDGIVLPSRDWLLYDSDNVDNNSTTSMTMEDIKHELEVLCIEKEPHVWGKAVLEYGDSDDISDGIDKCLRHFDLLRTHRDWKEYDNVFAVVLANLKHAAYTGDEEDGNNNDNTEKIVDAPTGPAMARRSTTTAAAKDDDDDADADADADDTVRPSKPESTSSSASTYLVMKEGGDDDADEDEQRSLSLLNDLRNKLPFLYLHLHDLDIAVENKSIESVYWERRLSELSKFTLAIDEKRLWSKLNKEFYTQAFIDDERSVYHISNPNQTIRFFCGFDPYRCQNQHIASMDDVDGGDDDGDAITSYIPGGNAGFAAGGNNSALKIFLYSRQSGRLIKVQNDPRNEIGLGAGSTDFCQGLTIIIDDHNGTLPLNPTKQDTAYGHSKYGQIHAANLKEWTAAIVHFYWTYHYMRLGERKSAITQAVSKSRTALEEAYRNYSKKKEDDNNNDSDTSTTGDNSDLHPTTTLSPLYRGSFISFGHVDFLLTLNRKIPKIRAGKSARESVVPNIAYNEVARLNEDAASLVVTQILTQSASKKRKSRRSENNDINNNGGLLVDFSQQPQQQQQQYDNVTSPLITNNRLPSSQDDTGELERELFQNEHQLPGAGYNINGIPQQNKRRRQSPNATDVKLQQYVDHNRQLQGVVNNQARDVQILQDECRKLTGEKEKDKKIIENVTRDRNKWIQYGQSKADLANTLLESGNKMHERLKLYTQQTDNDSRKPAPTTSSSGEEVVDLTDGDVENAEEMAKLRKQLVIYKSRADFYQKETEAKKVQIDNLMQEKSRFEDRVRDLEQAQLEGGDMLQF